MTGADLVALLKKHPIGVICGVVSIACGAALYLRADNLTESQKTLEARSAEANKMATNVRNSAGLAEQVAEIQAQRKEFDGRLMKAGQLAVNLQYFYKLEAETEVKLVDVRQNNFARNAKSPFVSIPFMVSVQGSYAQVINFLSKLQNGRHFCRINIATFNRAGGSSDGNAAGSSGDMTLSLSLDILGQQ